MSPEVAQAFRRLALALVLGAVAAAALLGVLALAEVAVPGLDPLGTLVQVIGENLHTLWLFLDKLLGGALGDFGQRHVFLLLTLIFALPLSKGEPVRRLDLRFFAPFDRAALDPIGHETGLLRWHLADSPPAADDLADPRDFAQRRVWDGLAAWVETGTGDGYRKAFWRRPELPQPFSWAVLAGPNGQGKTQLAREFARALAQRDRLGDGGRPLPLAERLRRRIQAWPAWWRRCNWDAPRAADAPWDAGALPPGDPGRRGRLDAWRPRRPTLILVDEPQEEDWGLIELLLKNAADFHHPVRLLYVDQCLPARPGLDFSRRGGAPAAPGTTLGCHGGCYALDGFRFSEFNLRSPRPFRLLAGTAGPAETPRDLWSTESLRGFYARLNGDPVLSALGVLWLGVPGHRLDRLAGPALEGEEETLTQDRSQGAAGLAAGAGKNLEHRLLDWRVDELVQTFREAGLDDAGLLRAIGCATLAGGLDLKAARDAFGFTRLAPDLVRLFPHGFPGGAAASRLPPVKPALVGDRFLLRLPELIGEPAAILLSDLVRLGWILEPGGMVRALARLGRRGDALGLALREVPEPKDSGQALDLARGFAEAAIRHRGSLAAALAMAERALTLGGSDLARKFRAAILQLARIRPTRGLPAAVLYCRAAEAAGEGEAALAQLAEILPRAGREGWPTDDEAEAFRGSLSRLLALPDIQALAASEEGCERLHRGVAEPLWKIPYSVCPRLAAPGLVELARRLPAAGLWAELWSLMALSAREEASATAEAAARLAEQGVDAFTVRAWRYAAYAHAVARDTAAARKAVDRLETLAGRKEWRDDRVFQVERADSWRCLAYAYSADAGAAAAREAAERVEAIAGLEEWRDDRDLQWERATAWRYVAHIHAERGDIEDARAAVERVEAIAGREAWRDDRDLQWPRAGAWRSLAHVHSQQGDMAATQAAAERVEVIAGRDDWRDDRDLQGERTEAWRYLAYVYRYHDVAVARAAAERVEALAGREEWRDDRELQWQCASTWRHLAHAHAEQGNLAGTRAAVDRVEALAGWGGRLDDRNMQEERARAWRHLAYAYHRRGDLERARRAAARALAIARRWRGDGEIQGEAAWVWIHLAQASQGQGYRERARRYAGRAEALCARPEFAGLSWTLEVRGEPRRWSGPGAEVPGLPGARPATPGGGSPA